MPGDNSLGLPLKYVRSPPVLEPAAVHAPPGQQAAQQAAEAGHRLPRLRAGDGNGLVVQQRAAVAAVGNLRVEMQAGGGQA